MQEIVTPLVEFARSEREKLRVDSLPRTAHEKSASDQARHLRSWEGLIYSNLRSEAHRKAQRELPGESLGTAPTERESALFAAGLLDYIREQAVAASANVQPNKLRMMASGAGSDRAYAYYLSETARREFMFALNQRARQVIDALLPGVAQKVPAPVRELAIGQLGVFKDRAGQEHPLMTAQAAIGALMMRRAEPIEIYGFDLDALKALISAAEQHGLAGCQDPNTVVPLITYSFDKGGWPVREVSDLVFDGVGVDVSRKLSLEGWGDRAGEPLLDFARSLAVSPVPVEGRESSVLVDHGGNVHTMVDGATAAAMIMAGHMPELMFEESQTMHEALEAMGGYASQPKSQGGARVCTLSAIRYVVYQQSPVGGKWRNVQHIAYGGQTPFSTELAGWGDKPSDPIVQASPVMGVEPHQFNGNFRAEFVATGYGVLTADELHDIDSPLSVHVLRELRAKHIHGVEVASVSLSIKREDGEADGNDLSVQAVIDFSAVKGSESTVAKNQMRKGIDMALYGALVARPEGRITINRLTNNSVVPIQELRAVVIPVAVRQGNAVVQEQEPQGDPVRGVEP